MSLVKHKYKRGVTTLRIGSVLTTLTWDGLHKKPVVTRTTAAHTVPEEGSLDSLMATDTQPEEESLLISHPQQDDLLFIGA